MSTSLIPDPMQLWRDAVTRLESSVNSLVTGSMDSQEVMRSLHQFSTVSLGLERAFEKAIDSYLAKVNLPSRKDIAELAATLQRVEDKLDRLLPANEGAAVPRPARTRRPPGDTAEASHIKTAPRETAPAAPVKRAAARARGRR